MKRRLAVFGLLASRKSNDEISQTLGISKNIVARDVRQILMAFAVRTREHVIREAFCRKLIVPIQNGIGIQTAEVEKILSPMLQSG